MTLGNDSGTDGETDRKTDGQTECDAICGPLLGGPHKKRSSADSMSKNAVTLKSGSEVTEGH